MPKVYYRNTPTERRCRECGGSGDITVRRKAGDPESEVTGDCPKCIDGWVRWAPHDPLTLLKDLRRVFLECRGFEGTYRNMRRRATGGMPIARLRMVEAAIRCDVKYREVKRVFRRSFDLPRHRLAADALTPRRAA